MRRYCRKRRYPNRGAAEAALIGIETKRIRPSRRQQAHRDHRHEGRAYECPTCGGWHLTSMERSDA